MKNTLEGISCRLCDTEEHISYLEDRIVDIIQSEQQTKNFCLRGLWDKIKYTNIPIYRCPRGEEKEKKAENLPEEIIAENFPNPMEERGIQVQEAQSSK